MTVLGWLGVKGDDKLTDVWTQNSWSWAVWALMEKLQPQEVQRICHLNERGQPSSPSSVPRAGL